MMRLKSLGSSMLLCDAGTHDLDSRAVCNYVAWLQLLRVETLQHSLGSSMLLCDEGSASPDSWAVFGCDTCLTFVSKFVQ
jgi:hypothetical protein